MKECPLCDNWTDTLHRETIHWRLIEHPDPHEHAALHLMLLPIQHTNDFLGLSPVAQEEFWKLMTWVQAEFDLHAYGMVIRCGTLYPHAYAEVVAGTVSDDAESKVVLTFP